MQFKDLALGAAIVKRNCGRKKLFCPAGGVSLKKKQHSAA